MRKSLPVAVMAAAALVSGCAHRRFSNGGPDEFAVARQAPLVVPPDYALVPPQPGAAAVQANTGGNQQTLDALFGGPAPRSQSETAVLNGAGYDNGDIGVRSNAGDPKTNVVDKGATTRDIVAAPPGDGQDARASAGK